MKLNLEQQQGCELEVTIKYSEMDETVKRLISVIESSGYAMIGSDNGRQYKISAADIYYIESVDKRTFIYTKEQVYRSVSLLKSSKAMGLCRLANFACSISICFQTSSRSKTAGSKPR